MTRVVVVDWLPGLGNGFHGVAADANPEAVVNRQNATNWVLYVPYPIVLNKQRIAANQAIGKAI